MDVELADGGEASIWPPLPVTESGPGTGPFVPPGTGGRVLREDIKSGIKARVTLFEDE